MTANILDFISEVMEVLCDFFLKFFLDLYLRMRASLYLYKYTITEYGNSVAKLCTCLFHDKQCFGV